MLWNSLFVSYLSKTEDKKPLLTQKCTCWSLGGGETWWHQQQHFHQRPNPGRNLLQRRPWKGISFSSPLVTRGANERHRCCFRGILDALTTTWKSYYMWEKNLQLGKVSFWQTAKAIPSPGSSTVSRERQVFSKGDFNSPKHLLFGFRSR